MLRLYLNFYGYEMLIEGELCIYFTAFLNNRQQSASDKFNQFVTLKEFINPEIIDGNHSTSRYFLDRKQVKNESRWILQTFFIKFFSAGESNDRP